MIVKDGYEVYPLRTNQITKGDEVIWELPKRGKNWFILDLALGSVAFIPAGSTGFITADGLRLAAPTRREGAI